jgi:hypothetical protein
MNFFGEEKFSSLPCKKNVADENLHIERLTKFLVKLQCSIFLSPFLFLKGGLMNFFFSKTISLMKAGQNEKHDITKISDLVQVCGTFLIFIWIDNLQSPKMFSGTILVQCQCTANREVRFAVHNLKILGSRLLLEHPPLNSFLLLLILL